MHWRSYIGCVQKTFLNPWYRCGDEETQLKPYFSDFNISDFRNSIMEFLESYGVEQYWSCKECKYYYYDSDWNEMTWESYGWHECSKRPQNQNLKSFPFENAPQRCFAPSFWVTSYGSKYCGRDEDEYLKEEYHDKYKEYKRT